MANSKQYNATTTAAVATSTTAKTVLAIVNGSTTQVNLIGLRFSNDWSVTAGVFLVELVSFDQTTAGTPGAAETVNKVGGTADTSRTTSVQRGYTAEPTTGTPVDSWYVPAGGLYESLLPLGREIAVPPSKTYGLRVTAPSGTPNVRATLTWEE
jgi:hypothetical protein